LKALQRNSELELKQVCCYARVCLIVIVIVYA
jgi:hypothetical protein